ncbi:formiminoglutamase [Collimonas sp. OK242]|jgi:formiminoglutamase|uniref:formimidoylglutamase n=1 Tax=Collimonas sp. OK242 TaxID=1798195 RepID=UPI00089B94F3|nr:formimidoylglutamase [Collimonas sp. OK242]SDX60381.1 formiminoglutamase [Collimonas sp. OK242]
MIDPTIWAGRRDTDSAGDTRRLHQVVKPFNDASEHGAALIGFSCDEGVRRNHGRIGAAQGPDAIRRMLANLPAHGIEHLFDAGNIYCVDRELEQAQLQLADRVKQALSQQVFPVILGGGHEVAYGTFLGIAGHLDQALRTEQLLIINFDAHFDLRESDQASSGTPFKQIAEWCHQAGVEFNYLCYGISRLGNTPALFARARELGVHFKSDSEIACGKLADFGRELQEQLAAATLVYLTIDLDVLPAEKAPGVSAPAALGMQLEKVEYLIRIAKDSGKLIAADIAECNPTYDRDGLTAKVAARLAHTLLQPD